MPLSPSGSLAQSYAEDRGGRGPSPPPPGPRRVVLKRNALEVEEDEGTGATPKLAVPKRRLHAAERSGGAATASPATAARDASPAVDLHTDLHDVHAYVLANWVFQLLHVRPRMQSLRAEVLPLLMARQYRGGRGGVRAHGVADARGARAAAGRAAGDGRRGTAGRGRRGRERSRSAGARRDHGAALRGRRGRGLAGDGPSPRRPDGRPQGGAPVDAAVGVAAPRRGGGDVPCQPAPLRGRGAGPVDGLKTVDEAAAMDEAEMATPDALD